MSGSQACRCSPHGSIEKEMRHFMGGSRGGVGAGAPDSLPSPPPSAEFGPPEKISGSVHAFEGREK